MGIDKLDQMFTVLRGKSRKTLVAASANDAHTICALNEAVEMSIIDATLVGDAETIKKVCNEHKIDSGRFSIVHQPDELKATAKAVALINEGKGSLLMKGNISTDKYMRAILNKENGLMEKSDSILTHITVLENPRYHKLLIVADVAIIPLPDLRQKITILNYLISTAHSLEIDNPKVAVIAATEQVSLNLPACTDAAIIAKMAERGQIKGAIVDGPLAFDVAVDRESCEIKKLKSEVGGDADCLLFPNIESGNVFFKVNTKLAGAELGAVVVGAKVPCVLTSRGDSEKTKLYSIALAALLAR